MAERRMFAKTIIDSDAFLDMPQSSQNLYFHLSMRADDDGFINNPKKIMRIIGSSQDDMNVLIAKKFLIIFEGGVVVIKHWLIHNYIRKDRYRETSYTNEKKLLTVNDNGSYSLKNQSLTEWSTIGLPTVDAGKDRIGKDRIGKDSIDTMSGEPDHIPYVEVIEYLNHVLGTSYKTTTKKTRELIKARWNEKFTLDDFKRVIDIKFKEWRSDKKMSKFLRPETLFGTKFESYLNQEEPTTQQTDTMRKLKELHDRYEREGK